MCTIFVARTQRYPFGCWFLEFILRKLCVTVCESVYARFPLQRVASSIYFWPTRASHFCLCGLRWSNSTRLYIHFANLCMSSVQSPHSFVTIFSRFALLFNSIWWMKNKGTFAADFSSISKRFSGICEILILKVSNAAFKIYSQNRVGDGFQRVAYANAKYIPTLCESNSRASMECCSNEMGWISRNWFL